MKVKMYYQLPFWHGAFVLAGVLCMNWNENNKGNDLIWDGKQSSVKYLDYIDFYNDIEYILILQIHLALTPWLLAKRVDDSLRFKKQIESDSPSLLVLSYSNPTNLDAISHSFSS